MKLKTSLLKHPSGIELETPLFVPSYSSKGFTLIKEKGKFKSEVCKAISIANEILVESQLVSAYDLYYDYLLKPKDFVATQITFIDSGGYEISSGYDFSETRRGNNNHKEWNSKFLEKVINEWPVERFPAIIISFDDEKHRKPLIAQIEEASIFFSKYNLYLHDFLIKPETETSEYVKMESILNNVEKLKQFHIIGVTEKELGNSILERMQRIHKIRISLDLCKNKAPIHVFGSLDPITTILYFLAGAEIFDGLTWLKYSYFNGVAMYTNNLCALNKDIEIDTRDSQVRATSIINNIHYLSRLKNTLINFVNSGQDFDLFDELGYQGLGEIIRNNYTIFANRQKI